MSAPVTLPIQSPSHNPVSKFNPIGPILGVIGILNCLLDPEPCLGLQDPITAPITPEFKRDAVRLAGERGNNSAVARDLGIDGSNLRSWIKLVKSEADRPFPGKGNPQDPELAALLKENARLREDNEILKKAVGIFTKLPR